MNSAALAGGSRFAGTSLISEMNALSTLQVATRRAPVGGGRRSIKFSISATRPGGRCSVAARFCSNRSSICCADLTVTVKLPFAVFPRLSLAEQLTVFVPAANVDPLAGVHVGVLAPSTRSAAETVNVTVAPAGLVESFVMFAGSVNTGAFVSLTVTVNDPDTLACAASVTVQVTVVVPSGNVAPDAHVQTAGIVPSSTSIPVALKLTGAPDGPVASTVILAGGVNVGGLFVTVAVVLVVSAAAGNAPAWFVKKSAAFTNDAYTVNVPAAGNVTEIVAPPDAFVIAVCGAGSVPGPVNEKDTV